MDLDPHGAFWFNPFLTCPRSSHGHGMFPGIWGTRPHVQHNLKGMNTEVTIDDLFHDEHPCGLTVQGDRCSPKGTTDRTYDTSALR